MASLQVYVRDLGRGLVMLGGRDSFGAGGYLDTPLEQTLPVYMDVRDRERIAGGGDGGRDRQVGQHGGLPLHRRLARQRQPVRHARIREGRHRQGGRSCAPPRRWHPTDQLGVVSFDENAHWAVQTGADRLRRARRRPRLRGRWQHEHLRRAEGGLRRPRHQPGVTAPHHPDHRRLVDIGRVRRAAGGHAGGRDHALHHRHRRRVRTDPAPARRGVRRAVLRRRRRDHDPRHLRARDDPDRR